MRSSARNHSHHEIAGIETSTKLQPARNRSQHSQSETATNTKSQPARIRSQHNQHETTANTKSQPPRNRRRKLETHQCNEAQLQRCSIETIVRAVLRFNKAQFTRSSIPTVPVHVMHGFTLVYIYICVDVAVLALSVPRRVFGVLSYAHDAPR